MKKSELRRLEHESAARERKMHDLLNQGRFIKKGHPGLDLGPGVAEQLLADIDDELHALVNEELRARPDEYVQDIHGGWHLVERMCRR